MTYQEREQVVDRSATSSEADGRWRIAPDQRPTTAVIEAVAAVTDTSPLEMDVLADAIDPDALDKLVQRDRAVRVEFTFHNCEVVVSTDEVVVRVLP